MMDEQACKTPLVELLQRIPIDAVYQWQEPDGLQAFCSTPIGAMAHEATDRIAELEARNRELVEGLGICMKAIKQEGVTWDFLGEGLGDAYKTASALLTKVGVDPSA
jgi:hypothetical protein